MGSGGFVEPPLANLYDQRTREPELVAWRRRVVVHGRGVVVNHGGVIVRCCGGYSECSSRGECQCACNEDANDYLFHHKNS